MRVLHIGDPGPFARSLFEYLHVQGEDAGHEFLAWSRSPAWTGGIAPRLTRLSRLRLLFAIPRAARRAPGATAMATGSTASSAAWPTWMASVQARYSRAATTHAPCWPHGTGATAS